ncbi:MAG: sulfatase-like hydrolase/transferase [Kiritimatiellaeota bacterium]|nr:sulfatase-like hydrolase/transferase [Kiritimatiellota bacterium]
MNASKIGSLVFALGIACASRADPDRPNILFLTAEDTSAVSIGCYRAPDPNISTPNLDALAERGIVFENCYCMAPVCAPSRFTMVTGIDPVTCGPAHQMRALGILPPGAKAFPEFLRDAGYYTANWTKTDYNANVNIGRTWNDGGDKASWTNRPAADTPFYCVLNDMMTHEERIHGFHHGVTPLPAQSNAYVRPYMPDTQIVRGALVQQSLATSKMDALFGEQLAILEASGQADNTIIFFSSDHGNLTLRSKRFLSDAGIRIPLIAYFPPKWQHLAPAQPGSRLTKPVSQEDFAPTFLALAGLPQPDYMKGVPFAGKDLRNVTPRKYAFSSRTRMDARYDISRSVQDGRWVYVRNFCPDIPYVERNPYMFSAGCWLSWAQVAEDGKLTSQTAQFWGRKPSEELYDNQNDPNNMVNLAADPKHAARLAEMRQALHDHIIAYYDNGLLPEGCDIEGYEACRAPGAWDVAKTLDIAWLASDNDPQNIPALITALKDPSMPIRWWAAAGLRVLGKGAAAAKPALLAALNDASGFVRVEAATALARQGVLDEALPVLAKEMLDEDNTGTCGLYAANTIYRLGKLAAPIRDAVEEGTTQKKTPPGSSWQGRNMWIADIMKQALAVLDGKAKLLTSEEAAMQ